MLAVVTEASLDRPLDILEAYAALGVDSVAFNFEEIEGSHAVSSLRSLDTQGLLRGKVEKFIGTILRERDAKYPRIKLRETDWMLPSILSGDAVEDWLTRPMTYLTVLADGRVSSFCPELAGQVGEDKGFPVCQVQDEEFSTFADRIEASAAYAAIRTGVDDCRVSCEYFELCGGGCPSNKFFETGNFAATETLYCRIRNQYVADAVLDYIIAQGHAPTGAPTGIP